MVTAYERHILRGEWEATLIRYRECCLALGTTLPSRAESERWMAEGPLPGFIVPERSGTGGRHGSGRPQSNLWQIRRRNAA